ncbi:MAG: DUF3800 domain-containing protein [Rhodospirillaceae bacterium]|nr:DUF3800 domain-containing protein [Rhodospirillaceae bacterium]
MTHSYLAFIDESGDDGLERFREPGGRGGSSNWLVLSACLFRRIYSLDAIKWRDEISSRMPEKRSRTLHFTELNHNQRVVAAQTISTNPLRVMSVLAAKRTVPKGIYDEKNHLYFYMARYLIERLSWLCRDHRHRTPEGDGRVAITFSRRGGMSYDAFREYLQRLKAAGDKDIRIHWPVIDIDAVDAKDHSSSASLQLVDAVASSFAAAVEPNVYGNCEIRYAELLKPVTYHRGGNFLSYGVKIVPKPEDCGLSDEQKRLVDLFR